MKLGNVGWVVPMMMGVAAMGTVFAFAASHSLAGEERTGSRAREGAAAHSSGARCVSTPLETTRVIDRKTLYIEDRSGNAAILHMSYNCLSEFSPTGFEYRGSSQICNPIDADITGGVTDAVPLRCMVSQVQLLSKDEAKTYRGR